MFGRTDRPRKKFYRELISGEPISPQHQRPKAIGEFALDIDRQFFGDFLEFGEVLNWWLSNSSSKSRWRLQEKAETELTIGAYDSPSYGRRYDVYCGPINLGILEISALHPYANGQPNVHVSLELMWARLLTWDTMTNFLGAVATHIDTPGDTANSFRIVAAMNRCLWDSQIIRAQDLGLDWGNLELALQGSADFYFARKNSESFQRSARVS